MLWMQPISLFPFHFTSIQPTCTLQFFPGEGSGKLCFASCFAEVLARNIHCSPWVERSDQVSLPWLDFVKPKLTFPHWVLIFFLIIYTRTSFITLPDIEVSLSFPGPWVLFVDRHDICLLPVMRDVPWFSQLIKCHKQWPWNSASHFFWYLVVDSVWVQKFMWVVSLQEVTAQSIFQHQCVNACVIASCFCLLRSSSTGKDRGKEDIDNLSLFSSISEVSLPV